MQSLLELFYNILYYFKNVHCFEIGFAVYRKKLFRGFISTPWNCVLNWVMGVIFSPCNKQTNVKSDNVYYNIITMFVFQKFDLSGILVLGIMNKHPHNHSYVIFKPGFYLHWLNTLWNLSFVENLCYILDIL